MERRRGGRKKRRITCELQLGDRPQRGIVLDLSPRGLFVQTDASPAPGSAVRVALRDTDGREACIETHVARRMQVPRHLRAVAPGGLGLAIDDPGPDYLAFLEPCSAPKGTEAAAKAEAPAPKPDAAPRAPRFQVRIKQLSGPRSRTVTLEAASAEAAERQALEACGPGWSVLGVEEL